MALDVVNMEHSLQLKFNVGETEDGRPITRTRTLNRIRYNAEDEDLYQVALALVDLQQHDTAAIVRNAPVAYEEA